MKGGHGSRLSDEGSTVSDSGFEKFKHQTVLATDGFKSINSRKDKVDMVCDGRFQEKR